MTFLKHADYQDLPPDDHEAFVYLHAVIKDRFFASPKDRDGKHSYDSIMDYMNEVAAVAEQLNVGDLQYDGDPQNYEWEFSQFDRRVNGAIAKIRIGAARRNQITTVRLGEKSKRVIRFQLQRLREAVEKADLSSSQRKKLLDALADFESELANSRFPLWKAALIFGYFAATFHDVEGIVLDTPKVVKAIAAEIVEAKEEETGVLGYLANLPPMKVIEDQRPASKSFSGKFDDDLDDDVPF